MDNKYNFHGQPIDKESLTYELSLLKKYIRDYIKSFCKKSKHTDDDIETLESNIFLVFDSAVNMIDNTIDVREIYPDKIK